MSPISTRPLLRVFVPALVALSLVFGSAMTHAADPQPGEEGKVLRHVVLFKFKETVSERQVAEVVEAFAALPSKIDAIKDFEWGTDVGVENKSEGFTHGFIVTFDSTEGRDAYLPHPAHKEFGKVVSGKLDKVLVFDFWAKEKP